LQNRQTTAFPVRGFGPASVVSTGSIYPTNTSSALGQIKKRGYADLVDWSYSEMDVLANDGCRSIRTRRLAFVQPEPNHDELILIQ